MAAAASAIDAAVPTASQRSTRAGLTCRSAIAPKSSGDTKAAVADVAKANGLMDCRPWASSTGPSGTNHAPNAMPWRKNSPASSTSSIHRMSRCTPPKHTGRPANCKPGKHTRLRGRSRGPPGMCLAPPPTSLLCRKLCRKLCRPCNRRGSFRQSSRQRWDHNRAAKHVQRGTG